MEDFTNDRTSDSRKSRAIKRTKSCPKIQSKQVRPRKSSLNSSDNLSLKRVRSCEDVRALSAVCCKTAPSARALGDFTELPIEVIHVILDYLPIADISRLALSSKSFRDVLIEWMDTVRPHNRLLPHFRQIVPLLWVLPCLAVDSQPQPLPTDFRLDCRRIGGLLKRLTCLFSTQRRLNIFKRFADNIEKIVQKKITDGRTEDLTRAASGIILHSFIAGWDRSECLNVFNSLSRMYNLHSLVERHLGDPNQESWEMHRFIRLHLRSLFLDFCAESDRSIWVSIVFDPAERSHSQVAQLLILLYAPIQQGGKIDWTFVDGEYDPSIVLVDGHPHSFKFLADTLMLLPKPSCKLLDSLFGTPWTWDHQSIGALFLFLEGSGGHLMKEFFRQLSCCHDTVTACWILTEVVEVYCKFHDVLQSSNVNHNVSTVTLLNIFQLTLNCGWNQTEKNQIIVDTWQAIQHTIRDLFQEFLITGNDDKMLLYLDILREISTHLSN